MSPDPWAHLPPPLTGVITHADHGEDIVLRIMFDRLGIPKPTYLDVGAFDPYHINNTATLYASGARGINIEPNPKLMETFKKLRPHDLNIECAVGPERMGKPPLHLTENPGLTQDYSREWLKLMPSRRYTLFFRTRSNMIWVRNETIDRLFV